MDTSSTHSATPPKTADAGTVTARVTVVIPCYNQAHFLEECLASVVAQTYPGWEAVVVDDTSPDGEDIRKVVESFGSDRIRLIRHETNRGLGGSRNTGIRSATTEFVYPLDADDRIHPETLEQLVDALDRTGADCAYGDVRLFGTMDDVLEFPGPEEGGKMLRAEDTIPGAGTMMRRRVWDELGGYDEAEILRSGREDFEFWIRAFDAGCRATRVRTPLYEYRILHSSMNITCRLQDHKIAAYIYEKHKTLFDAAGETKGFLCYWTEKAALASYKTGNRKRAFDLALRSFKMSPSRSRLRGALRALLPYGLNRALEVGEIRRLVPFARYPLHGERGYRPFFVIGVGGSGDTLIRTLLTSHPALHLPPETFVLGDCIKKFKRYGSRLNWPDLVSFVLSQFRFHPDADPTEIDVRGLRTRLANLPNDQRNLAAILDGYYRHLAAQSEKAPTLWGDMTPLNSLDDASLTGEKPRVLGAGVPETLERILATFPDARFLHVYRDGCDVVYSHLRRGFFSRLEDAAERWLHVEGQTRRFAQEHAAQSIDVRYEDLLAEPEAAARRISAFLDVEFDAAMLAGRLDGAGDASAETADTADTADTNGRSSPLAGHFSSFGSGRRKFDAGQKEQLQRLIGRELELLGYPPVTDLAGPAGPAEPA